MGSQCHTIGRVYFDRLEGWEGGRGRRERGWKGRGGAKVRRRRKIEKFNTFDITEHLSPVH